MIAQTPEVALVEVEFVSRADVGLPQAALVRLERQCWAHNVRAGLTGELRLENGMFTQVIEGTCSEILSLASRILTDARHSEIAIRAFRRIEQRRFATWSSFGLSANDAADVPALAAVAGNLSRLSPERRADCPRDLGHLQGQIQIQG